MEPILTHTTINGTGDAVLLLGFGGPESMSEVGPFWGWSFFTPHGGLTFILISFLRTLVFLVSVISLRSVI